MQFHQYLYRGLDLTTVISTLNDREIVIFDRKGCGIIYELIGDKLQEKQQVYTYKTVDLSKAFSYTDENGNKLVVGSREMGYELYISNINDKHDRSCMINLDSLCMLSEDEGKLYITSSDSKETHEIKLSWQGGDAKLIKIPCSKIFELAHYSYKIDKSKLDIQSVPEEFRARVITKLYDMNGKSEKAICNIHTVCVLCFGVIVGLWS